MSKFIGAAEAMLRGQFTAINAYIRKEIAQVTTYRNKTKKSLMNPIEQKEQNSTEQKSKK